MLKEDTTSRSPFQDFFKGKKITLMGLGLLGRGVGDAQFLAPLCAELTVTDLKSEVELADSLDKLRAYKNIRFVLGRHDMADFRDADMVLKAAGVPLDSPYIAEAQHRDIPVEMDASLFAKLTSATIIGITGTRGKSTTTELIFRILEKSGKRVFLGGNIRGMATLSLLERARKGDFVVLELDSWQLQGFGENRMSPHIGVFTTFYPDHMNYYKGDPSDRESFRAGMDAYLEDKANIFKYQTAKDFLVLGEQAASVILPRFGKSIKSALHVAGAQVVPRGWSIRIPGEHNRENIALALKTAEILGIGTSVAREAVEAFTGVPDRLEFIREVRGVKIYNDTTATTPEATRAGLHALGALGVERNIILIMGGNDKNLAMDALIADIPNFCRAVVLLAGTGTTRVGNAVRALKNIEVVGAATLAEAVAAAVSSAREGDTILFSPAFASFGMFRNEFDRGDRFRELIAALS